MKTRFIERIGTGYEVIWIKSVKDHVHSHRENITVEMWNDPEKFFKFPKEAICDKCNESFVGDFGFGGKEVWNTEDGKIHEGDMWYEPIYHGELKHLRCPWDNCNDPRGHLMIKLPNGNVWDLDSRASNCTMKDDKTHRCWVCHGEVPNLTVDKNGHTCQSGAGSILSGNYHGFLRNGEFTNC